MSHVRVRFKLNPGRDGIALGKLSKQSENIENFLRSISADLGIPNEPGQWLAKDFKNGSVFTTTEHQAVVDASLAADFNGLLIDLIKHKPKLTQAPSKISLATLERFADLRSCLELDEAIGIGLFEPDTDKKPKWFNVSRLHLEDIAASVEAETTYVGAVIGETHEWNKGAKQPYIIIRDIASEELVKCSYRDSDYKKVASLFDSKDAVITVYGTIVFNRITGKSEVVSADDFEVSPEFSRSDYEAFFGCAPGLTGDKTSEEFIGRGDDEF
jgi:hypothetical protein